MSYIMVARWRARDGETESVESLLHQLAAAVRKEPGNAQFTVHRSLTDANEFLLYEVYASEQAFLDHQATEHFKLLVLAQAVPLLDVRERKAYSFLDVVTT